MKFKGEPLPRKLRVTDIVENKEVVPCDEFNVDTDVSAEDWDSFAKRFSRNIGAVNHAKDFMYLDLLGKEVSTFLGESGDVLRQENVVQLKRNLRRILSLGLEDGSNDWSYAFALLGLLFSGEQKQKLIQDFFSKETESIFWKEVQESAKNSTDVLKKLPQAAVLFFLFPKRRGELLRLFHPEDIVNELSRCLEEGRTEWKNERAMLVGILFPTEYKSVVFGTQYQNEIGLEQQDYFVARYLQTVGSVDLDEKGKVITQPRQAALQSSVQLPIRNLVQ